MKKKFSQKGFTLIELLAVIVILGVIMLIAVPSISTVITNSRKDSFLQTADQYISAVRNMAVAGTVEYQVSPDNATLVSVRAIELEGKAGKDAQSPFGARWDTEDTYTKAYVVIRNTGTSAVPSYSYYFVGEDLSGNCMPLTLEKTGTRSTVTTGCNTKEVNSATTSIDGMDARFTSTTILLK